MQRLDPAVHALFSEFREAVYARVALEEDLKASRGAPVRKTVKGRTYWYLQAVKEGQRIQRYLGPDTPEVRTLVEDLRRTSAEKRALVMSLRQREAELARTLRAAGVPMLPGPIFKVVEVLSAARIIWGRGLLVGTLAFGAYAGLLGWRWDRPSVRTVDIDIAVEILTSSDLANGGVVSLQGTLQRTGLLFREVPPIDRHSPPTSLISDTGIRVDLLCGLQEGPPKRRLVPWMEGLAATPLVGFELLMKNPEETVLLGERRGVPVLVPEPARFAFHKLVAAADRPWTEHEKRQKDIVQASQLISALLEDRPEDLMDVWSVFCESGRGMRRRLERGLALLPEELRGRLKDFLASGAEPGGTPSP